MCQATVYLDDKQIMEDVIWLEPTQDGFLLRTFFGEPQEIRGKLEGISTTEPAFGLPALWITKEQKERAAAGGYTVVDAPSVLATHLTEVIRRTAAEIPPNPAPMTTADFDFWNIFSYLADTADETAPAGW